MAEQRRREEADDPTGEKPLMRRADENDRRNCWGKYNTNPNPIRKRRGSPAPTSSTG